MFTKICVAIVVFAPTLLVTWCLGYLNDKSDDYDYCMPWILSSLGFAICLTLLLVWKGVV